MIRFAIIALCPVALAAQTPEQLFEQRKYDEARAAFQAQLAKNKNDVNALFYMGRIAEAENKHGDAVNWFEKAVRLNDTSATYHLWLGSALGDVAQNANKLRQPFLARRVKSEFERAVQLDPKMIDARQGLVDFYSIAPGVMGGSMDKAKDQAAEMVKLHPIRGHMAFARIAQRQKDLTAEESAYKAALAAAPDSGQPYYSLAAFYRRQTRWPEAFATYEQLQKARPNDLIAQAGWGITAAQSGTNLERGEKELTYFLENKPADMSPLTTSSVHWRLGQIYERTQRRELARAEYAEAVRLNPQNQDAKKALEALK